MPVYPSPLVAAGVAAGIDGLWTPTRVYAHNWLSDCRIDSAWLTDLVSPRSVAEKRQGLVSRPYRTLTVTASAMSRAEMRNLDALLARLASARSLWPVFPDLSKVTNIAGGYIYCSPQYRRFFTGGYAILVDTASPVQHTAIEVVTMTAVEANRVQAVVAGNWSDAIANGTVYIYPGMEVMPDLSNDVSLATTRHGSVVLTLMEAPGRTALPASIEGDTVPSGFAQYDGKPVVDLGGNWTATTVGRVRTGSVVSLGRGQTVEVFGSRARQTGGASFYGLDREDAWKLIQLFDSRRGQLYPFWTTRPDEHLTLRSVTLNTLVVDAAWELYDWNFYSYIFIKTVSGNTYIRKIQSVSRNGDADTLTLTENLPELTLSDIYDVGMAYLSRLDADDMKEEWLTDTCIKVSFNVIELIREQTITIQTV